MKLTAFVATGTSVLLLTYAVSAAPQKTSYAAKTGEDLARICADPVDARKMTAAERERLLVCGSYIQGFMAFYGLERQRQPKPLFCLPSAGVSGETVRKTFLALGGKRPQVRDMPASVALATALAWVHPCDKKGKP